LMRKLSTLNNVQGRTLFNRIWWSNTND